jgi:OOP family OmpA-OmpF porin
MFQSLTVGGKIAVFVKPKLAKTDMFKKLAFGLVIGTAANALSAQTNIQANTSNSAYVQDARGVIARTPDGLCWRTGYWTPADAVPGCDGALVPPISNPTAPAIVPPAPIAQAPVAPAVPVVPVPLARCDFTATLDDEQTFAFDRTALTAAAKKRIDAEVIRKLSTCNIVDVVVVTGHTDRLGTPRYNRTLSERRAGMVAAYLKSKGVTAKIDTHGAGANQPVSSCTAKLPRRKLIECLAPDRRVVIEVRGEKN